jgi:hypothetical protein
MNRFKMRSMATVLLSAAALLALPSCSDKSPEPRTERVKSASYEPGVPGSIAVDTTTHTARVVSVFDRDRELVLDLPNGKRETVKCGPEIVNFDQIHRDDQVKVTIIEQVAVAMASEFDPPDNSGGATVALSPRGGQPGAIMAGTKQVTATVSAIDMGHHMATLEFPDGKSRTIAVRPDIDLSQRKVGEKVVIRTTDVRAVRVEKPQAQ